MARTNSLLDELRIAMQTEMEVLQTHAELLQQGTTLAGHLAGCSVSLVQVHKLNFLARC